MALVLKSIANGGLRGCSTMSDQSICSLHALVASRGFSTKITVLLELKSRKLKKSWNVECGTTNLTMLLLLSKKSLLTMESPW